MEVKKENEEQETEEMSEKELYIKGLVDERRIGLHVLGLQKEYDEVRAGIISTGDLRQKQYSGEA